MKQFYILGQRVNTYKFGLGTVVGFEVLNIRKNKVTIHDHQTEYDMRIIIKLDNPSKWQFGSEANPHPYCFESDIIPD